MTGKQALQWLLFGACCLFGGCRYQAGYPIDRTNIRTIYVKPAIQDTLITQASGVFTRQLREQLARNRRLRLKNVQQADVTLETTLIDYQRAISTLSTTDTDAASTLTLELSASCSLYDNRTHTYRFRNQRFTVNEVIAANDSTLAAETQSIPILTQALAKKIAQALFMQTAPITQEPVEAFPSTITNAPNMQPQ